jgi:hypothetical protein
MLKPKNSQSSGCTHIHKTSQRINKPLPARKLTATDFWNRERSADCGINATMDHDITKSVLHTKQKKLCMAIQNKRRGMLTYGSAPE